VCDLNQLIDRLPGTLVRMRWQPDGTWKRYYVAPSVLELTGYHPDEAAVRGWFTGCVDAETLIQIRQDSERAAIGEQVTSTFCFRHRDGRNLWLRSIKLGHIALDGVPELVAIWSDVTLERDLAKQLAQAERLAQLGEVLTEMAHELNQPIASISLASENSSRYLAAKPPEIDRARVDLSIILEQSHWASAIIDQLRQFRRVNAPVVVPLLLRDVVTGAKSLLREKLEITGVQITDDCLLNFPAVLAAAVPLQQVIINLIVNACDAYAQLPSGKPRGINMRARQVGTSAEVTVSDQAGGIPSEFLSRVFQPFFTTKPAGKGTGLGLSTSYGIISSMGGTISVSNIDGGASFTLTLPLAP
jgi:signal transduction histidine kinase